MKSDKGRGGRELGNLIPQDDGFDTVCFQVTLPNTPDWINAFYTLVYKFSEGRYWKRTASGRRIADVQETGLQILDSLTVCDELTQDQINQILDAINNQCGSCGMNKCCCPETPLSDAVNVNEEIPDYPLPLEGDTQDDDPWFFWKCQASTFAILLLRSVAQETVMYNADDVPVVDTYGDLIGRILRFIFPSDASLESYISELWWWFLGLSNLLITSVVQEVSSNIAVFIDNNLDQMADIVFCQENPLDQKTALKAFVDASPQPVLNRFVLKTWIDVLAWSFMWIEEVNRPLLPAYATIISLPVSCSCSSGGEGGAPEVPATWITVPLLVDSFLTFNDGSFTFLQNIWTMQGIAPDGADAGTDVKIEQPMYSDMTIVNNADIGGFIFICDGNVSGGSLPNGFGKDGSINVASSFSNTTLFPFLTGQIFAGVINTAADLQVWIDAQPFEFIDKTTCTINNFPNDVDIRWVMFGGDNTTFYDVTIRCFAIVKEQS